jgi:hypothetical protein
VTATPKPVSKPISSAPARSASSAALALAGLLIGSVLWIVGARYTIDGVFTLANMLLSFVRVPLALAVPPAWPFYLVFLWLPFLASRVEWTPPLARVQGRWVIAPAHALLVWAVIATLDALTTYAGLRSPSSGASALAIEIAKSTLVSGILSAILTFVPEWLVRVCRRQLWR